MTLLQWISCLSCDWAGQRWWQDVQKATTLSNSKPVTADAVKPATAVTGAASAVKQGTRPVPAATAPHRSAAAGTAAGTAGRAATIRGGQTPARGDVTVVLMSFI